MAAGYRLASRPFRLLYLFQPIIPACFAEEYAESPNGHGPGRI